MNKRLLEIIAYKTGGKQNPFADLMGWSPQYLTKLVKGGNFGLQPVLSILKAFPEINARWFLFGQGQMLETGMMFELQRQALTHIQSILDFDKYIPVMTGKEIKEFQDALKDGREPCFSPSTFSDWQDRLTNRTAEIDAKFAAATAKSDELCKALTAK